MAESSATSARNSPGRAGGARHRRRTRPGLTAPQIGDAWGAGSIWRGCPTSRPELASACWWPLISQTLNSSCATSSAGAGRSIPTKASICSSRTDRKPGGSYPATLSAVTESRYDRLVDDLCEMDRVAILLDEAVTPASEIGDGAGAGDADHDFYAPATRCLPASPALSPRWGRGLDTPTRPAARRLPDQKLGCGYSTGRGGVRCGLRG